MSAALVSGLACVTIAHLPNVAYLTTIIRDHKLHRVMKKTVPNNHVLSTFREESTNKYFLNHVHWLYSLLLAHTRTDILTVSPTANN